MRYVREQGRWPALLVPLLMYGLTYWITTHIARPTSLSFSTFINGIGGGFALGSTLGLVLQFFRLVFQHGIYQKNVSPDAIYLLTRFLPINVFLYVVRAALVYWASLFPPHIYEATQSACAAMIITYMLSYSRFYQSVVKPKFQ